ncbi:MAG: transcription antitermination factor NusB, partial [Pseudomonadales bacterium]
MREYLGAVATLEAVIRDGQHLDDAKGSDAFATEIAYGVVRHYYQLSEALERLMEKPLPDKHLNLRLLLLAGLYAIGHLHRPVHASVNAAVSATEPLGKPWAKGLVNGVLRNALRGKKNSDSALSADGSSLSADGSSLNAEGSLSSTESSSIEAQLNHPSWLIDELKAAWPDQDLFAANNARAPMVLRVNLTRTSRAAFVATLKQAGIGAAP